MSYSIDSFRGQKEDALPFTMKRVEAADLKVGMLYVETVEGELATYYSLWEITKINKKTFSMEKVEKVTAGHIRPTDNKKTKGLNFLDYCVVDAWKTKEDYAMMEWRYWFSRGQGKPNGTAEERAALAAQKAAL
jgi:hypothetical protein